MRDNYGIFIVKPDGDVVWKECETRKKMASRFNLLKEDFPDSDLYIGIKREDDMATHLKLGEDQYMVLDGEAEIVSGEELSDEVMIA